jgi:hypothetical protein
VGEGSRFGKMALFMRVIGRITCVMGMEGFLIKMEVFILVDGCRIWQMAREHIWQKMEESMKENGKTTNSKARELRNGQMELLLLVSIKTGRKMGRVFFAGIAVIIMREISKITKCMVRANMCGKIAEPIMENG